MKYFFHCDQCDYDSNEARFLTGAPISNAECPMCASDGKSILLDFRPATPDEQARLTAHLIPSDIQEHLS